MKKRHLDLFSGIGGFALAAERVWPEMEHTFCDNEPFSQAVLLKHWPNAKIYGDIRTLTNTRREYGSAGSNQEHEQKTSKWTSQTREIERFERPYLLTGGFPCQPFSNAGQKRGKEDDRYLWPEMVRIIREFQPDWVVGENVAGIVNMVLNEVLADLEHEGYEVGTFVIPAVAVNAPHRRDRVWIVAHAKSARTRGKSGTIRGKKRGQDYERIRKSKQPSKGNVADPERSGYERQKHKEGQDTRHSRGTQFASWDEDWTQIATALCRMDDGVSRRLDRNPRLKALGNAIVPQVATEIFKAIKEIDQLYEKEPN